VGTLDVLNDVVPFFPGDINTQSFEYQGMPLLLHAYVKEVNNDGSYVFAMRDMISEYADDVRVNDLFYNSRLTCLLFNQVSDVPRVPAVSSEGFSVSVCPAPGMTLDDLKKGMVIEVDNITEGTNGYLNGTFLRESPESRFSLADAFHQLMLGYAAHEVYNPKNEKDELANAMPIEKVYVSEMMSIIDAKATLEEDKIKAYNYLNFCRLLAIMLDSKERTSYYDSRLTLLEVLNDFATLDKVDINKIEHIAEKEPELFERNAILRHDFMQLRIIGYGSVSKGGGDFYEVGIKPGLAVKLTKHVEFISKIGFLGYRGYSPEEGKSSSTFGVDVDASNISFGAIYKF
jgi:hypothetical protein